MTREESLQIIQSCIDKLNSATPEDIERYRKIYEQTCLEYDNKENKTLFEFVDPSN